jgi:ABC-type multidrug transport system fused ATPase/permease subunit
MAIVGTIVNAVSDLVVTLMLVLLAVWIAPAASLMLLGAMIPVLALYFGIVRNRLRRLGSEAWEARRQQSRTVQESLRGHVSINVGNSFEAMTGEFDRGLEAISEADRRSAIYGRIPNIVVQVCIAVALVVVLVVGTGSASSGSTFILLGFAAVRIMPSVMSMAGSWNTLQASRYIVDIIGEANGFRSEADDGAGPMSFEERIEMRDVTFAFEEGSPVLSNFSTSFKRGESVGVRGGSGAGKSTLFNLLLGFYVPRSGGIYIDGVRLSPANRKSWQKIAGYVEQEVFIKNDTLARNIALSAAQPDRDRIRRLLRQVGLSEWAAGLENGLDTILGEGGSTVSGGERQRIGIARALYDLPRVLFVDEATSALDPGSEEEIVGLLRRLSAEGLTLFIISHRESALRHCDRIIDM